MAISRSQMKQQVSKPGMRKVKKVIKAFDLPTKLPKGLNLNKLYKTMTLDKKVKNNQMIYVIPRNIGKAYITNKIHKNIINNHWYIHFV